jgi:quercetin dioxygenase-like cupin family protein
VRILRKQSLRDCCSLWTLFLVALPPPLCMAQQDPRPNDARAISSHQRRSGVQIDTLLRSSSSWDGTPYVAYPRGRPQVSVLRVMIAPHTTMQWHSHPMPNTAYVVSGEITVEKERRPVETIQDGRSHRGACRWRTPRHNRR